MSLKKNSIIFQKIYKIYEDLEKVKETFTDTDKCSFTKYYINGLFGKLCPDGKYPYERTFNSFDDFIDYHLNNIQKLFIDNCVLYYKKSKGVIEKYRKMILSINLSSSIIYNM